jgi:hypothetical protein
MQNSIWMRQLVHVYAAQGFGRLELITGGMVVMFEHNKIFFYLNNPYVIKVAMLNSQ